MTSYNLSMFDTPRQPKAPEAKYDLSMLDQGQPKTIWQPLQPEQVQAATTIASFGDTTKSASMDKLRSELRQYLGDDAPMVGSLNFEDAQRQLQRAQMDHILRDSPHTARWFTEQVQQGKTPYDVGTLANIERFSRGSTLAGRLASSLPGDLVAGMVESISGSYAATGATVRSFQGISPAFGSPASAFASLATYGLGLAKEEMNDATMWIARTLKGFSDRIANPLPDDAGVFEKGWRSGQRSIGANILPLAAGFLMKDAKQGASVASGLMAASVGGSSYLENIDKTNDHTRALLHGMLDATWEYVFEKYGGTGALFDKATWANGIVKGVLKFLGREVPSEMQTTVMQKADDYLLANEGRSFEQFIGELPDDLLQTVVATIVGGGGQVAAFKGLDALAGTAASAEKAQAAHDNLTALLDNVAKSELYLNDPDTFAQFFQGVAGDATVTVDPVKLVEAMTAANVTEEALPSLKDQLSAPGEIELTVQELATAFAGTGAETTLLQHVRPEPDLPTLAESKEQTKAAFEAFQEAGEKALARFQADEVFNENLKAVKDEIVADVLHTGRTGQHYADGYGTLMAHFYATMAKAHGVTPLQIRDGWTDAEGVQHRGYNPRVVGPEGQVRGRTPAVATDFKPGRVANLLNRDNWAVLEAGNPNGVEATPEENAAAMAKLKAYLDKEGIEYYDAKGSYFGTKADSLLLLGVTAERASEIGNMFGQESIATRHGLVFGDGTVAQATGIKEVRDTEAEDHTFLPAFGSAFRLEIPDASFENKVKLDEVLNQTRPAGQRARATVFSALADANTMANAVAVAKSQTWQTGRDLKLALDSKVRELAKAKKIDPASPSEDGRAYLVQMLVSEASLALEKDTRAVGWYADRVTRALSILSLIHPELNTDQNARFTFIWALAVTSNGLKVNKNFELAEIAYRRYKAEGKMPTDVGIGAAAAKINEGLGAYNTITESLGMEKAIEFMNTRMTVRDLKTLTGKKISGEGMDTEVLGAAVLGPKIGNGFFANLYGHFDQLTMDRWFVRTWGRWTGTLVRIPTKAEVDASSAKLKGLVGMLSKYEKAEFEKAFGEKLRVSDMPALAQAIADITAKPEPREAMRLVGLRESSAFEELLGPAKSNQKRVSVGDEIRKLAIGLTRLIDGQKEAPGGSKERDYMRAVYAEGLAALQEEYPELTMSDLQAVMWYPEKQLYETAKLRDENSQKEYEDDEVPDYATAAVNLAKQKGVKVPRELATDQRPAVVRRTKPAAASFQQTGGRQGAQKPAGLTITGVHFSPGELTELLPSKYGKGLEGAERARVMASKDARIKRRTHFYVNTGQGVFPEAGTGGKAHVSELANLYDADVDALGLFKGKTDEQLNAAESAVLDAGYSGYVMRGFGNQGAAVVFGARVGDTIPTKFVGGKKEASVPVAPAAQYSETQRLRRALTTSKDLPHGAMTAAKWREHIGKVLPDLLPKIEASGAFERVQGMVYRDELARAIEPPEGQFYQSGWYSPLTRAFQNVKQAAMPGSQWASWLAGNKAKLGLKDDEIQWSGLNEYLELRGKDKVTREEIVDYLSGNGVVVEDVVKGGPSEADIEAFLNDEAGEGFTREEAIDYLNRDAENADATKFSGYWDSSYKGGIRGTYREILVTLPVGRPSESLYAKAAEFGYTREDIDSNENLRANLITRFGESTPSFKSDHWKDTPNVLVHVRLDEVMGADGKRYVRVGEIQSDWGQKGKKEGFGTQETGEMASGPMVPGMPQGPRPVVREGVPSAPFVTDTKAWVALAIKRAIMHAVDVGAAGVVFGTGEQNANLYDLSKQVDRLDIEPYGIEAGVNQYRVTAMKDGAKAIDRTVAEPELANVVGKDIAKEAIAGKTRFEGEGLRVGGEGMRAFYNKIVPQVANDVLKKIGGGKVGLVEIADQRPDGWQSRFDHAMERGDYATAERLEKEGVVQNQPGFPVTPEMREKVQAGMPLFQKPQSQQDPLGGFNPNTMEITLLANSNLSTFLHETGHFFLTAYADMAAQEGAPQQIVDDMNAILKWFGVADLATWNAMSVDQQRPYHEQFAESFEQYLFSGKAPTKELQSLFQRFAKWLTRVYGSIKEFVAGHPGAKLDPEMAAVMDRMLATEAEIAAAEDNRNYEALFRTAAEAGMTPAQFAAYLDLPEEARAQAEERLRARSMRDMKWLQNRRNRTIAALQKEAAAARAEVRKEVTETVAQEPIFRALRWLKRGELTNPDTGEEVKVTAGNKLSIPALEGMYPEGALGDKPDWRSLGYGQYGMLANEGQHPDIVADMFGFDSGAALVDALVNAPKFKDEVEGRTDQIMLERHGDLSSPDKIAQAADEAIHNEVRTKLVATELSFLDKMTGSPSFLIKAAKEYARQLVANRTSKTLKAWVFAADEVRAGKAATAALKKGDTKLAASHKRTELLNHAAVREAHAAEKEIKAIADRLRKLASYKDDDSAAKSRDMDMVNAVRAILFKFGFGTERKGKTAMEYLSLVEANDPAMAAVLRDLVESTTDNAKDWRTLKLSELRDLRDAVDAVWAMAKRAKLIEIDGKLVPRRQIEQELYDRLDEIGIPDRLPGEGQAVTEGERNMMKFSTFVAALRRVESWAEAKDGEAMGPFRKYIWSQIKDAADTYRVEKARYLKAYRELLDAIAPSLKRELIDAREIGYTFGKGEGGMGKTELLHAILHTGNTSNKRKLLLGRGWATDNGDGTLDTSKWDAFIARMIQEGKLTKAHYDFAQGVWDLLDSTKVDAQKAHRSVFGRYFAEVTADAFTTPFGDYRGGYVPAQADPEIVQDAQLKELANQENENMVYAFPSTPKGFTKSRVEYNRPLRLDLRSLAGHIDKVLLFSYLTEPVSDVRRVILSKTVSQALGRVDPKAIGVMLTPWLNRVAKQIVEDRVPGREPLARFWSVARARAGMSAMFANLANSVQQITGISLAAVKVRPKYLLEAMAHGTMSPRKLAAHVAAMSPYMRDRMHNDVVLMGEAIDEILLNPGVYESAKAWSAKHAYFMQRAVDNYLSPMIWMGAFNQAKENGSDDLEARRLADSAVRETQGSQAPEDIAAFEQGTAFYRMFVQFAGYFNMNANLLGTEFVKISRDMGLKKGAGRGLYVLALGFYVPAVLGELIIQAFRGGPDDDDKDGEYLDDWLAAVFGYGPARYLTAMAPVVGQAANALFNTLNNKPYDDRISTAPAISMIESAVKAPISVYKAIADEGKSTKAVNDTATLIGMTVGVPARAVAKPISYLTGVANEEIAPEDTYDAIRGTITGTASPGSKQ